LLEKHDTHYNGVDYMHTQVPTQTDRRWATLVQKEIQFYFT